MKKRKRDQQPYELVQQHLPGLILNTILKIVEDLGDPYQAKPGLGGMTAYPPRAMAIVCILMEAELRTYRKMVGHLRMHPDIVRRIGLPRIPSKSTIWRAYGMIPEQYLRAVRARVIGDIVVAGYLAGDSTDYSSNRFVRWFSIRHDQVRLKRGWVKMHSIVDVSTRAILDYLVTDGYTSDISRMWPMPDRIEEGADFCLDSTYLTRKICDVIAAKDLVPRIRPKSNTVCKNEGSQAWGGMIRTHRNELDRFMDEYHQRSIIEAVFGQSRECMGTTSGVAGAPGRAGR